MVNRLVFLVVLILYIYIYIANREIAYLHVKEKRSKMYTSSSSVELVSGKIIRLKLEASPGRSRESGSISFPTRIRYGTEHSMYAFVCTYGYVHAVHVKLVVEHGYRRNTCAEGSETRDITCYRRRFHVERARPLVNVWRFTAPTTHLN